MPNPKPPARLRLHLAEWLGLWVMLLALGGYIGYSEYLNYQQIDSSERVHLARQAKVVEKNLAAQLVSADRALQGLRRELASSRSNGAGATTMDERLQLISDSLTGISTAFYHQRQRQNHPLECGEPGRFRHLRPGLLSTGFEATQTRHAVCHVTLYQRTGQNLDFVGA